MWVTQITHRLTCSLRQGIASPWLDLLFLFILGYFLSHCPLPPPPPASSEERQSNFRASDLVLILWPGRYALCFFSMYFFLLSLSLPSPLSLIHGLGGSCGIVKSLMPDKRPAVWRGGGDLVARERSRRLVNFCEGNHVRTSPTPFCQRFPFVSASACRSPSKLSR